MQDKCGSGWFTAEHDPGRLRQELFAAVAVAATVAGAVAAVGIASAPEQLRLPLRASPAVVIWAPNVHVFDPSMSTASVQSAVDSVLSAQERNQLGTRRDALLSKPGRYDVNGPAARVGDSDSQAASAA